MVFLVKSLGDEGQKSSNGPPKFLGDCGCGRNLDDFGGGHVMILPYEDNFGGSGS